MAEEKTVERKNLDKLIGFWRSILDDKKSGLPITVLDYIVLTVASLEELIACKAALLEVRQ